MYDLTGLIGIKYNGNIYHYIKNLQGDIIGLLNVNNEQIVSYEYDSWGSLISIKDQNGNIITDENNIGIINPFRYREYYYDSETGMYYLNSRYYNPSWGRFINADNIFVQDFRTLLGNNIYIYCFNNPVCHFDKYGHLISKCGIYDLYDYKYTIRFDEVQGNIIDIYVEDRYYVAVINNDGVALIRFSNNKIYSQKDSYTLSTVIHKAYEETYEIPMEGRTIVGVANEIDIHYKAYKLTGLENFNLANIGTTKNDSNAIIFETSKSLVNIVRDKTSNKIPTKPKKKESTFKKVLRFISKLILFV